MAAHQRVRFFMPGRHKGDANQPGPIFSPTQVETKESVLHSVFSPSVKKVQSSELNYDASEKATTSTFSTRTPSISTGSSTQFAPSSLQSPPRRSPPRRAVPGNLRLQPRGNLPGDHYNYYQNNIVNNKANSCDYRATGGAGFFSSAAPPPVNTKPPSPVQTKRPSPVNTNPGHLQPGLVGGTAVTYMDISPTSTITNDVFFSPQSSLGANSPMSATTGITHKTTSSLKAMKDITMLDVEKIEKSTSVLDLQNIIDILDREGKFQALLRKAKKRLAALLGEEQEESNMVSASSKKLQSARSAERDFNINQQHYDQQMMQQRQQSMIEKQLLTPPMPYHQSYSETKLPASPVNTNRPYGSLSAPQPPQSRSTPTRRAATTVTPPFEPHPTSTKPMVSGAGVTSPAQHHFVIPLEPERSSPGACPYPGRTAKKALTPVSGENNNLNDTNDSSLVLSLSSSMLDSNMDNYISPPSTTRSSKFTFDRLNTSRSSRRGRMTPSPVAAIDKTVTQELKKLTSTVHEMENARVADRKLFLEKLNSLEAKKNQPNFDRIKSVEDMMQQSSAATQQLLLSLEQLRAESQGLQQSVRDERNVWNRNFQEAQQLENRLCRKAEELTERLEAQPISTANNEVLRQYQEEIDYRNRENEQLVNNLRETLECLLVGLGRDKDEVHGMTRGQQKELVSTFTKQHLSSASAMEAMAQEVTLLEKERRDATRAKEAIAAQLNHSKHFQQDLERQNMRLSARIQKLSEEQEHMRNYINELSTNGKPKEEWEQQEFKYKEIIRTLKSQLRKEETMVSVGLYRAAMESARDKGSEVEYTKTELETMKQKYSFLESQLKKKQQTQDNTIALTYKHKAKQDSSNQRIAALQSELQKERENKQKVEAAAQEESAKLRQQVADMKFEMQENGRINMPKTPKAPMASRMKMANMGLQGKYHSPSATSPVNPKATTSAVKNKENKTGATPRSKFDFVKQAGGRTALRQRVQQLRSPRNGPTVVM